MRIDLNMLFNPDFTPQNLMVALLPVTGIIGYVLWRFVAVPLHRHIKGLVRGDLRDQGDAAAGEMVTKPCPRYLRLASTCADIMIFLVAPILVTAYLSWSVLNDKVALKERMAITLDQILAAEPALPTPPAGEVDITWFEPEAKAQILRRKIFRYGSLDLGRVWFALRHEGAGPEQEPAGRLALARIRLPQAADVTSIKGPFWCLYRDGALESSRYLLGSGPNLAKIAGWEKIHALCPAQFNPDGGPLKATYEEDPAKFFFY
ncbi:hypothetical protein ACEUZ9_002778 [Paracoccus litorisediminis]|uniref:hypothetical protein n=1 Tax=Paracoccus litorisediminis TaxID=2006130 RepID=UPI00373301B8